MSSIKPVREPKFWNADKIELLQKLYPSHPRGEILKAFPNKSWKGITAIAERHNIKRLVRSFKEIGIKLNDYDRGWIEAIIDGEGTVSLHRQKKGNYGYYYAPRVNIYNTHESIVTKFVNIVGKKNCYVRVSKKNRCKPLYEVWVKKPAIRELLSQIKLLAKEKQQKLLLEFFTLPARSDRKAEIYQEIRKFNLKGNNSS
jgi:hypothetical protein